MHSFENDPIVFARRLIARQANASGAIQSALAPRGRTRTAFNRRTCFPARRQLRALCCGKCIRQVRSAPTPRKRVRHSHRAASGIVNATHAARTTHAGPIVQRPPAHPHHAASGTASATRAGQVAQRLPVVPNRPSGPCSSSRQFPRRKAAFPRTRCPSPARTQYAGSAPPRPSARCPPQRTGG